MTLLMKATQILINAITIITLIALDGIIDIQVVFCITMLINSSMSIGCIFYNKAKKNDKIMMVFNTFLIFLIAQVYTSITGIFGSKDWFGYLYKTVAFCVNAIMMGVTFDAFKRYNEKD